MGYCGEKWVTRGGAKSFASGSVDLALRIEVQVPEGSVMGVRE